MRDDKISPACKWQYVKQFLKKESKSSVLINGQTKAGFRDDQVRDRSGKSNVFVMESKKEKDQGRKNWNNYMKKVVKNKKKHNDKSKV